MKPCSNFPDSPDFINRAIADIRALDIPANECREAFLTMLSRWANTQERHEMAADLPLDLFEVNTEGMSEAEAEEAEYKNDERFRNLYRHLFGDRAPEYRTRIRREVYREWKLFLSIFALVHPERAARWSLPGDQTDGHRLNAKRYLRAHMRAPAARRREYVLRGTKPAKTKATKSQAKK